MSYLYENLNVGSRQILVLWFGRIGPRTEAAVFVELLIRQKKNDFWANEWEEIQAQKCNIYSFYEIIIHTGKYLLKQAVLRGK